MFKHETGALGSSSLYIPVVVVIEKDVVECLLTIVALKETSCTIVVVLKRNLLLHLFKVGVQTLTY